MFSRWCYILIGNNNTGKTSFQRGLVGSLCNEHYTRLPRNVVKEITHDLAPRKLRTIFTANRSYQEKLNEYKSVQNYFAKFFSEADICVLSSHSHGVAIDHVQQMMVELRARCYNVAGVFWSNEFGPEAKAISALPWQERFWIDNPVLRNVEDVTAQIEGISIRFAEMLVARASAQ